MCVKPRPNPCRYPRPQMGLGQPELLGDTEPMAGVGLSDL